MRDDLLDAQAAIDWAVAQIPVLEQRFEAFIRRRPYEIVMEPDPNGSGDMLMVCYSLGPPDAIANAETGAIINSLRSSLDLLFTSLLARCGMKKNVDLHFPIRKRKSDLLDTLKSHERKNLLGQREIAAIKQTRPYRRGNKSLFFLNYLDIVRKHRRLIQFMPIPSSVRLPMFVPHSAVWRHREGKSVLLRFPAGTGGGGFVPTKDNTEIILQISFYEPAVGIRNAPVLPALRHLAEIASDIVKRFDDH